MKTQNSAIVFTAAMIFVPLVASAGGGYEQARIYSRSPKSLHVEGYVNKDNVVKDFNIVDNKIDGKVYGKKIKHKGTNQCFLDAPLEQPKAERFGHVNYPGTPAGYNQVMAWLNMTNDGTAYGSVEVRSMEIWGKDQNGNIFLVSDDLFCKKDDCQVSDLVWGSMLQDKAYWSNPTAWALRCANGDTNLESCGNDPINPLIFELQWNRPANGLFAIPTVVFQTSQYPNQVFHPWLAVWGDNLESRRPNAQPDIQYAVRVIAKVNGSGRLQAGLDYWAPPGTIPYCEPLQQQSEHCEGAVSNWQCESDGWVTIIAGAPGIIRP
ncbi:MAG: hypothetical protein K8G79_00205 [bacterium]|uniref:Uncharacterized protein n=1 Tax=Candidatus Methylomirabilis tolerans TaxID=3123416 RepID=A0AAJ1AFT9_9BACT|nr:hypothetical protein [Candidatus Methylomirabilis sp.]